MSLRRLARSIVAARAETAARAAGRRVEAPGRFRRFLFAQGWAKAKKSWGSSARSKKSPLKKFVDKLGVSL